MGTDLSLPESERDTGNLMWNITGVLRKPDSVGLKGSMVCLYFYMCGNFDISFAPFLTCFVGVASSPRHILFYSVPMLM